ncbi:DNA-3-methyladenine glycosylase I [Corallococcus sp. M34]|uniref:DNA-3-methyladenine glycosylase I n=1 Tax=Citreicoccus inhibens TaxID=2849499 RepID=UPI001C2444F4|nr:DNA-3-methyladenine glycosylase I [Citreicoccus inhibens]MBU8895714.1 DNA-3-methyladenine glycosylase I [Citreicoccus inhibens]
MSGTEQEGVRGADGQVRCGWAGIAPELEPYHDTEWGFPVVDDTRLFEKLCLEGFQSGLSWLTILRKREAFREAFEGFDSEKVARFTPKHVEKLLGNAGIIRHRGKIESAIHNAKQVRALRDEFGSLAAYFWRFEPGPQSRPARMTRAVAASLTQTPESQALAKDLKKRGWTFVGPTTVYAFMQAMGLVNDHLDACCVRAEAERRRDRLKRPK